MKKFLFLLLALVLSVSVSCSDDKTGDTGGSMLSVTPTEIEFEAAGGSRLLDLRTDAGAWSLTQSDNTAWCTPALTSGKTSTSFAVTATANESSKRSATLTFTAPGCDPVVVTVTQSGDASQDFEGEQVVAQPDAWDNRKRADISYQLLVYSFADGNGDKVGDLPGLTRQLDYIDALGASAVWLSPIHPAASYHGYDVLDYEAVNPAFGTDADLRAFIDAAHARGIRVYLDYVLNHTGKDHPWFKSAAASEGSPYRDRYIFSEDPQADIAAGRIDQIATEGAAGYDAGTAAAIVYKASWPEEKVLRCTIGTLEETARENQITKTALIVVGEILDGEYLRSELYNPAFSTEFRKASGKEQIHE